jgi:hypothetical protein
MKRVKKMAAGLFLLSQVLSGAAFAAPVTLAGTSVDFAFDDALLGLFGQANVSGDTLYFTPVGFEAKSLNGAGFALTNDTMNIRVSAHEGWMFSGIDLTEKGDYMLLGSGSMAGVAGQMRVFDIARPLTDVTANILPMSPLDQTGMSTHNWEALTATDLSAWANTRAINVTVENLMLASTGVTPSLAFVEKKLVGLTPLMVAVAPVPEAETYAMMLVGLGLVGWSVARRRAMPK